MNQITEALKAALASRTGGGIVELFTKQYAALLRQRMEELHNPPAVKVGDIVMVREGLATSKGGLKIVTEIFAEPVIRAGECGDNHEREVLTGKIGSVDSNGNLSEFCADLRRYKPVDVNSLPDVEPEQAEAVETGRQSE